MMRHHPSFQYDFPLTNEASISTSGLTTFDTRQIRQFEFFQSNQLIPTFPQGGFTRREMGEIRRSLVDIQLGNFKVIRSREELLADLSQ